MARYLSLKFGVADGSNFTLSIPYAKSTLIESEVRAAATAMIANNIWVTAPSSLEAASLRETNTTAIIE